MASKKTIVTFKSSTELLVGMFTKQFSSIEAAKTAIEEDASAWSKCHGSAFSMWVNPNEEDYFLACGKDGNTCIWQYFTLN